MSGPDMQDSEGDKTRQASLIVTSLNWGPLLGQMTTPSQETYQERAIHLALDLQGILHLAQRVQEEVHQVVTETEAVVTGEGMEETLVGKSSLGESSSKAVSGPLPSIGYPMSQRQAVKVISLNHWSYADTPGQNKSRV